MPGWNRYCKARYSEARAALFEWISDGRQRFGDTFEKMKQTRKIFINALNYCKKNKDKISDNVIADKYRTGDCKEFWKEVNKRRTNYNPILCEIDGKKTSEEIVELFYRKFSAVTGSLNAEGDVDDDQFRPNVNFIERLSVRKVNDAIANLSTGLGFDGVHSNHLKFSSPLMIFVFCKFFNSCLIHNYIPSSMLAGVINPVIKNKAGNVRDSRNFWEIMISSNFFKVFEYILLAFIKQLPLSSSQLGYRSGSSTILATTLLKEAIDGYISDGGTVYACFLDMSKAF